MKERNYKATKKIKKFGCRDSTFSCKARNLRRVVHESTPDIRQCFQNVGRVADERDVHLQRCQKWIVFQRINGRPEDLEMAGLRHVT